MTTVADLIKRGCCQVWRRVYIKRLTFSGTYESDWYEITHYVVSYGTVRKSFGDVALLGQPTIDGMTLTLNNADRKFNAQTDNDSLFYNYKSRYRTKFKIRAGVVDDDGSEVGESDSTKCLNFYGILYSDPVNSDSGTIDIQIASMLKVFENYPAYGVSVTSATTAGMVDRLVKITKSGSRVFDQYFEGATDADKYKINTGAQTVTNISNPSVKQDETIWKKLGDYATFDNFFSNVNGDGAYTFELKTLTSTVRWVFNGPGFNDENYGQTIISISSEIDGFANCWGRVAIEYQADNFAVAGATWTPGDGSAQDIFGERTFSASYFDLDASSAATVASRIKTDYEYPKKEWDIQTVFIPYLEIGDTVTINYIGQISNTNPFILGVSKLGTGLVSRRLNSINLIGVTARIASMEIDLNNLTCNYRLREA